MSNILSIISLPLFFVIKWADKWLSHCGEPCAFVDYVGWADIAQLEDELKSDIAQIIPERKWLLENFKKTLVTKGWYQGYLFRCVRCSQHRIFIKIFGYSLRGFSESGIS